MDRKPVMPTLQKGIDMKLLWTGIAAALLAVLPFAPSGAAEPKDLKVLKLGLGSGTITAATGGINCGFDCNQTYATPVTVTLTANPAPGTIFAGWGGDCSGMAGCTITMNANRAVSARFALNIAIPSIGNFTPEGIATYLADNPQVNTPARFVAALPGHFKLNWILMSRSESLQTGTAGSPRILLPSADARYVFTIGMTEHSAYPGAHPHAIEYMQWDENEKNFRFHEIVLDDIGVKGSVPARSRGVSFDDARCSKCHSTRNVLNRTASPGTTGSPPGIVKAKNKPNWDAYDSWAGALPFNRDRIYQGSVEAAAFRHLFNLWNWRNSAAGDATRQIVEQLNLQPSTVAPGSPHSITRHMNAVADEGHIRFGFDPEFNPPSAPSGSIFVDYNFGGLPSGSSAIVQGGRYVTLRHHDPNLNPMPVPVSINDNYLSPNADEGRAVQFFDLLGGLDGDLNKLRIADELANHRFATGGMRLDARPIALAIAKNCLRISTVENAVVSQPGAPPLMIDRAFFDARNGMAINQLAADTRARAQSLPRRKADIEKINLNRNFDPYLPLPPFAENGLIQQYPLPSPPGMPTFILMSWAQRQAVFRRPVDLGQPDATAMGGIYVDREMYSYNTTRISLYRYLLEPLGVSVDKWSMGVRGRSRTYTLADVFLLGNYEEFFRNGLQASLNDEPIAGLSSYECADLVGYMNTKLSPPELPSVDAVPTFTDVQRIFNKSCIECHGGLDYPPYANYSNYPSFHLDFSEDETLSMGARLARSYANALSVTTTDPATSYLFDRITDTSEACPSGLMPCGGPALSKADVETIRRWIAGSPSRPSTVGDPHITTVSGTNYDFQSAGEFVLLRDEFMEIQTRQTAVATQSPLTPNAHTGLASCVSLNSAVAVRVGPHRVTYQPNLNGKPDPEGLQLRVDGKLEALGSQGIALDAGGRIIRTPAQQGIQIEAPGGTAVIITPAWWSHYQLWYLNVDVRHPRATQGVMGAIAPGNWLPALPDGRWLGPRPANLHERYVDLYETFENAWRVTDANSLFDYAPGTSTKTFTIENWPEEAPRSCDLPQQPGVNPLQPPQPLPLKVAQQHCSAIMAADRRAHCEQDVMVTGEPGFAATYLAMEQIERNALPTAPELVYPDNHAELAAPVSFAWKNSGDQDGDGITYRHCVWAPGEIPTHKHCHAAESQTTVSNLAAGRTYLWKVIADDGKGGSTASKTRRFTTR